MHHARKTDLKAELQKSAELLRTLRDEVHVQLHLGGLEVKDEWRNLEPRLESVLQQAARDASDATRTAVEEVTTAVRKFRESLR
jgi:hypothetical protein